MTHTSKNLTQHPKVGDIIKGDTLTKISIRRVGPARTKLYTLHLENKRGIYVERTYYPRKKEISNYIK